MSQMIDFGLVPAVQGATRPAQRITWTDEDENPLNLSGATLTGKIMNTSGVSRVIDGTLTVTDAAAGIFTWEYGTTDVASEGAFKVQFSAAFGSTPTPARTLITSWTVYESIV